MIRQQYETQGHPYYASARLWDDGVIDPVTTRDVLALGLATAMNAAPPMRSRSAFSACSCKLRRHEQRSYLLVFIVSPWRRRQRRRKRQGGRSRRNDASDPGR